MSSSETAKASASVALEANATGIKVGASGGGAARLSEALADLLSPFSNAAGFLGDRLSEARREATYRAARKGVNLLESEGIRAGDVPPKILLPWLEGASLEPEGEESLEDAWAGLLARAVKSSDAAVTSYMEVLKRIGSKEAQLLEFFATDTSPIFSEKYYDPQFAGGLAGPMVQLGGALEKLDQIEDPVLFNERMEHFGLQTMCQIIYYSLDRGRTFTTKYFDENEHAVSNLEHLGLIRINRKTFQSKRRVYTFHWFELTKFGFDMMWACRGQVTGKAGSSRVPDQND